MPSARDDVLELLVQLIALRLHFAGRRFKSCDVRLLDEEIAGAGLIG
jgi:hypothetical protein